MMNKQKAIIIDIDGTLANCDHRRHFVTGGNKNWKSFLAPENVMKDTVNEWCDSIATMYLNSYFNIIFITGRPDCLSETTYFWLKNNGWFGYCVADRSEFLFMRPENDRRPDHIVKEEIYLNHIKDKFDVLFVIDDRKSVVDMWRRNGLVCLQCAEGEF